MQFIFVLAIVFFQVFRIHFGKVVEIVRTLWVYTFMDAEKFTVFLGSKSISAVRADKPEWCGNESAGAESLPTDLALALAIAPIVVIDEMVRGTA